MSDLNPLEEQENMRQARGEYLAEDEDELQLMLASWHRRVELERIRTAAKEQDGFFFDAMRRNGVL